MSIEGTAGLAQPPSLRRRDLDGQPARPNFVLRDISLQVRERGRRRLVFDEMSAVFPRGRNVIVLGGREAGAKLLVRLLTGMERPQRGSVSRYARISWPMTFSGFLLTDGTMRENTVFLARLYGEDPRRVAAFVRDVMAIGKEFDQPLSSLGSAGRRALATTLVLAVEFDCYILDGNVTGKDEGFVERWHAALNERLRTADIIQISNSRRLVLPCHEMGAILGDGKLRFYDSVAQALALFNERPEEADEDVEGADLADEDRDEFL